MNGRRSNSRFNSTLSFALLALCTLSTGFAGELPLRGFNAKYDLYHGGMHVATARLSLQPEGDAWRWVLSSSARGIYALFIDEEPRTETVFTQTEDGIRLQEILVSDDSSGRTEETAKFDWERHQIDVVRKRKTRQLPISASVYDYQSIHLLAAAMGRERQEKATVDFYRSGKLVKSRLVYSGEGTVTIDGKDRGARIYEQVVARSNSKMRYYYDADNPLLPLRVEKLESGETPTVMTLRDVDWSL